MLAKHHVNHHGHVGDIDNAVTVTTKTNWACENGFGGMMAWVASSDDAVFTLERAVVTELNKY